jgi:ATP-dependent DNA helicase RecG
LPFELTGAQARVLREIYADMGSNRRMNRLLQGDVGSGKTIVALFAMLLAVESGRQAVLMAPTELLAEQHVRKMGELLQPLGLSVRVLTGQLKAPERKEALKALRDGSATISVGTHALIQEGVEFHDLGLVVVDEQHRFGVRQRMALGEREIPPDTLIMSATPIPRSLAMTLYGDLDLSLLDEMPEGRKPVTTLLRYPSKRDEVYRLVDKELEAGRQAYIVYPLVEESDKMDLRSATEEYERLSGETFPNRRVGLIHGQRSGAEKDQVMRAFLAGDLDVLVATTVIEVGIDVPNASVMVVEHAERFGLSQLHQLRGRVGRGAGSHTALRGPVEGRRIAGRGPDTSPRPCRDGPRAEKRGCHSDQGAHGPSLRRAPEAFLRRITGLLSSDTSQGRHLERYESRTDYGSPVSRGPRRGIGHGSRMGREHPWSR